MSNKETLQALLSPFFHNSIIVYIEDLIVLHKIQFILSKPRKTKLGDYRAIPNENLFIITVNDNLNPVQFLITVLHELAHHVTWIKYKRFVKPHGKEWKQEYQRVFMPILTNEHIDEPLKIMLASHLKNPKASSYSDTHLNKFLNSNFNQSITRVADTPMDKPFVLGKRTFVKEKKLRTRFLCTDLGNNKKYLIHGHTELH
jgi:SprT protein